MPASAVRRSPEPLISILRSRSFGRRLAGCLARRQQRAELAGFAALTSPSWIQHGSRVSFLRPEMEFIPRFFRPPERGSFFLFGPRGTGKSLWAQTSLPTALRLDLRDPEAARSYGARPERLA